MSPSGGNVYLIDEGKKRHIPNPDTYCNLFVNWEGIRTDIDVSTVRTGTPISDGAILAQAIDDNAVFLIDGGHKRHVTSPEAMDAYHFAWKHIYRVPPVLLSTFPDGPPISA
jgi:hypothetical protein